jgi:Uma2 family endonuclease
MVMPTVSLPLPRYTVDDLDRFPKDGSRYELLEGWLIVSPAPSTVHQALVGRLFRRLDEYVGDGGSGHVYPGGDVRRGTSTLLNPDVLVLPREGRPGAEWDATIDRWLAIEVLSPSTQLYDRNYKADAYLALGVREVWLVDPRARAIEVHRTVGAEPVSSADLLRWTAPGADAPLVLDVAALFAQVLGDDAI